MIQLQPFEQSHFQTLISWLDSEELLLTIAGNYFTSPVTDAQLQDYLDDKSSESFSLVDSSSHSIVGHAEIINRGNGLFKIDKLLKGDQTNRDKGIGKQVMRLLRQHAFARLGAVTVELNVFDWNIAGIRCDEAVGFVFNKDKQQTFDVNAKSWLALNMTVGLAEWNQVTLSLPS